MQSASRIMQRRKSPLSSGLLLILIQMQALSAFLSISTSPIHITDAFIFQRSQLSPHFHPSSPTASAPTSTSTYKFASDPSILAHPNLRKYCYTSCYTKSRLQSMWSNNDELNGSDKIKACIPYVLPILDGDSFGKYIYQRVPPLHTVDDLFLQPLVSILQAYPIISIALFVLLSLGTRFSTDSMSRNVRFNAQQAVLIDMVLIFPTLIMEGLDGVEIPRVYSEFGCNFVWYFYMSAVIYSISMNLRGKKPDDLPYLSNFAETMTGPF